MKAPNLITLRAWRDFADFTGPAMKVDRVSCPIVMPPNARGVLEAAFWELPIFHLTDSIRVVKLGR